MFVIKAYGRLVHHLTLPQIVAFFLLNKVRLAPHMLNVPRMKKIWDAYVKAYDNLDEAYKWPRSSPETAKLVKLNEARKGEYMLIIRGIKDKLRYSSDPEIVAAAKELLHIIENYAGTEKNEYEAATAMIVNFVQELEKQENAALITLLKLTDEVANLKKANQDFQALYEKRFDERYAHKLSGRATEVRKLTSEAFDTLCKVIASESLIEETPTVVGAIREMIISINAAIDQYNIILNRHLGTIASNGGNSDFQTPDITNPEVPDPTDPGEPGGGTQTPDIDNPPPFGE